LPEPPVGSRSKKMIFRFTVFFIRYGFPEVKSFCRKVCGYQGKDYFCDGF
jgi:hypothetical protein